MSKAGPYQCTAEEIGAKSKQIEAALRIDEQQDFTFSVGWNTVWHGRALAEQGPDEEGIKLIHEGLVVLQEIGAEWERPHHLALLAQVYRKAGQSEKGMRALTDALPFVHKNGERYYEAELYRLKGEFLLELNGPSSQSGAEKAEACFHQGIEVARRQEAKSWELRAATSLARLWRQQGKQTEARDLLAPVYNWFTEGFDTADLKDAKALLDALVR